MGGNECARISLAHGVLPVCRGVLPYLATRTLPFAGGAVVGLVFVPSPTLRFVDNGWTLDHDPRERIKGSVKGGISYVGMDPRHQERPKRNYAAERRRSSVRKSARYHCHTGA